jgi:hypothetical protein
MQVANARILDTARRGKYRAPLLVLMHISRGIYKQVDGEEHSAGNSFETKLFQHKPLVSNTIHDRARPANHENLLQPSEIHSE